MPAPAVVLFHDCWGLNDQTKAITQEFTALGYVALAIDLFGGKVDTVRGDAKRQVGRVGRAETLELSQKWLRWLKSKEIVNRNWQPSVGVLVVAGRSARPRSRLSTPRLSITAG